MNPHRTAHVVIVLAAALIATAGCAPTPAAAPTDTTPAASPEAPASTYPVTIDNCGVEVTFDRAPERVVAIKSTSIEMMLALGAEDLIVGTAFSDGPVADQWNAAAANLPVLSERVPSPEAVLDLNPDLVYAGWESNITAEGAGDRALLASLGVNGFVSPAACTDATLRPTPLTYDDVFDEIALAGRIFDRDDAASALIADQRARLAAIAPDTRGLTALWYSSGSDTPYVGGGTGAPQMVMDAVGLTNIATELDAPWSSYGWESVVAADPDVIVLVDSSWGTTEKKIGVLEANPATATLDAVIHHRYLVVPFPASEAGVRSVEAAERLASQLEQLE